MTLSGFSITSTLNKSIHLISRKFYQGNTLPISLPFTTTKGSPFQALNTQHLKD